ncbi:RRM domain-containing protein [Salix suchowensis]|nr:RRM domain-containing protein [Salix suchowensis]
MVNDIPIQENQDEAAIELGEVEASDVRRKDESTARPREGVRKAKTAKDDSKGKSKVAAQNPKKRKRSREESEVAMEGQVPRKRAKKPALEAEGRSEAIEAEKTDKSSIKQRFILFVEPPPSVRLLTPKPSKSANASHKSKGCAFLEFSQKSGLQQALKLHQSDLDGRRINVELTAGGGGKSEQRLTKLRTRNKELSQQRQKHGEKGSKGSGNVETTVHLNPQRYSSTSGTEQKPMIKHTWTVGDTVEDEVHRGGAKHSKQRKTRSRSMGTGVNAIPVA